MMEDRDEFDGADAPTEPEDWVGAAVRRGGEQGPLRRKPDGIVFHVFRASNKHSLFAVTDKRDIGVRPECPEGGEWEFFKEFPETGRPRIGFSEKDARADIEKQGYHLNHVTIESGEATISSVAS